MKPLHNFIEEHLRICLYKIIYRVGSYSRKVLDSYTEWFSFSAGLPTLPNDFLRFSKPLVRRVT
jgi:hypothetical protein